MKRTLLTRSVRQMDEFGRRNILMHRILGLVTTVIFVTLGMVAANAGNPNVPTWSPYALIGSNAEPPVTTPGRMILPPSKRSPMTEGRSAYTINNPEGPLNDYYKDVGLSDDPADCATKGCAISNGS